MMKRITWFVGGAAAGIAGASVAKRKVKAAAAELTPANVAKKATSRVREAYHEGKRAMRSKEAELRARLDGRADTLADELDDGDTVLVDGQPVEPGKVIVLRQVRDDEPNGARRRRA
jgi:hypothetical protein